MKWWATLVFRPANLEGWKQGSVVGVQSLRAKAHNTDEAVLRWKQKQTEKQPSIWNMKSRATIESKTLIQKEVPIAAVR